MLQWFSMNSGNSFDWMNDPQNKNNAVAFIMFKNPCSPSAVALMWSVLTGYEINWMRLIRFLEILTVKCENYRKKRKWKWPFEFLAEHWTENLPFGLESLGCSWQTHISGVQDRVLSGQVVYLHISWQLMNRSTSVLLWQIKWPIKISSSSIQIRPFDLKHISLSVTDPGFPQGGAWTLQGGGGVNTQFCRILPKTAWNWKNLDAEGGGACVPHAPP